MLLKNKYLNLLNMKILKPIFLSLCFILINICTTKACDSTPSIIINTNTNNGDGSFTLDLTICIGSGGSADGFDLYFENGINVISTNITEITNPISGNTADVTVTDGSWEAFFDGFANNGTWFQDENVGWGADCISFEITVDANPEGGTICSLGINENCLGFTQENEFITCENIPGPCVPNYFITAPGNASGNTENAGENCGWIEYEDEIIEINIPCSGEYNFELSQEEFDEYYFWGNTIYATLGTGCCENQISQNTSWEETYSWTENLDAGTYYLVIDMWIDSWQGLSGEWSLEVSTNSSEITTIANAGDDLESCENSFILSANSPEENEVGEWTLVSGSANFDSTNDPNTQVSGLSIGENILEWSITGECGTSSDQIIITVIDAIPTINVPDTVFCLEEIELSADVQGDGIWTVSPDINVTISNPNSLNTTASVSAYGSYTFSFESCGNSVSQDVLVTTNEPIVSGPSEVYCLSSFNISAEVEGDPGYWSYEGPGNLSFGNPISLSTTATPDSYGIYNITYFGCGTSSSISVNVQSIDPQIVDFPDEPILCDFSANLEAFVIGDPNGWEGIGPGDVSFTSQGNSTTANVTEYGMYQFTFNGCGGSSSVFVDFLPSEPQIEFQDTIFCELETTLNATVAGNPEGWGIYSSPAGSIINFSNPNNTSTNVNVSEYGTYQFSFDGCGGQDISSVTFAPEAPYLISASHQDCSLEAELIAFTSDPNAGPWNQVYGPNGAILDTEWELSTNVTVPEYGLYIFEFNSCDTTSTIQVGFSCELQLPNSLTPNGDGNNDVLYISGMSPGIYSNTLLTIINRWGEEVYKSEGYGLNEDWWDGKTTYKNEVLKDGVYYYIFDVFNNVHNQKESYSGYLTIFSDE